MSLVTTLSADLKAAMKNGETERRDALRFLQSALKNAAIDAHKAVEELSDAEAQAVVKKLVKQRKDSIDQYEKGGRKDLADKEKKELELLSGYLPAELSREATVALVDETLSRLGPVTAKDMGRVMGAVMQASGGMADGALVREIVLERLPKA